MKARPPSFAAFVSGSQPVGEDAVRYLASELRSSLGFEGVPVRIWFRLKVTLASTFLRVVWLNMCFMWAFMSAWPNVPCAGGPDDQVPRGQQPQGEAAGDARRE